MKHDERSDGYWCKLRLSPACLCKVGNVHDYNLSYKISQTVEYLPKKISSTGYMLENRGILPCMQGYGCKQMILYDKHIKRIKW